MSSGTRAVSVVLAGITHDDWQDRQLQNQARCVAAAFAAANAEFKAVA